MATAEGFDELAVWFDARADEMAVLLHESASAATSEGVVSAGRLTTTIDVTIRSSTATATDVAGRLRQLAISCRERADACWQWLAELAAYEAMVEVHEAETQPGAPSPIPPPRPGPWAER